MVFIPPFGFINPLPTVKHNEFQSWIHERDKHKIPIREWFIVPKRTFAVALRLWLQTAPGRAFVRKVPRPLRPGRGDVEAGNKELIDDVAEYLKWQRFVTATQRRPPGPPPPTGYVTAPMRQPGRRRRNILGAAQEPGNTPDTETLTQWMEIPFRTKQKTGRDEPDQEKLLAWLERRYRRDNPARFMRRYR